MISLIIPPIIIIIILALLVVFFARAVAQADLKAHEDVSVAKPYKTKRTNSKRQRVMQTAVPWIQQRVAPLKRLAHKRRVSAAVHEVKMNKEENDTTMSDLIKSDVNDSQKLSRMGEIILSYHRGASDGLGRDSGVEEQEVALIQALEKDPKNVHAYERLGDYYMEEQKFEDALECYKYVLRLDPRHKRAQDAMKNLDRVLG